MCQPRVLILGFVLLFCSFRDNIILCFGELITQRAYYLKSMRLIYLNLKCIFPLQTRPSVLEWHCGTSVGSMHVVSIVVMYILGTSSEDSDLTKTSILTELHISTEIILTSSEIAYSSFCQQKTWDLFLPLPFYWGDSTVWSFHISIVLTLITRP